MKKKHTLDNSTTWKSQVEANLDIGSLVLAKKTGACGIIVIAFFEAPNCCHEGEDCYHYVHHAFGLIPGDLAESLRKTLREQE